jgi:glycosyltransferase involved in cell wall biosynthesis
MLKGNLDLVSLRQAAGWAQEDTQPDVPVSLLVIDNDKLLGRILANRYREDLENAGIGAGRHGFEFQFPKSLPPFEKHVIRICRETDGKELPQSPVVLEPSQAFDKAAQDALSDIIRRIGVEQDIAAKVDFLAHELDLLLQQFADHDSKRFERGLYRALLQRWRRSPHQAQSAQGAMSPGAMSSGVREPPQAVRRALVIDDRVPKADRDAGSLAILSHMRSLQRFGFEIVFAAAAEFGASDEDCAGLAALGMTSVRAPYYGSIEEVLRRQAGEFDVVYMHRVANAVKYGELARYHNPKARRIYSVADLHHLRFARQAHAEDRPELLARSRWLQFLEYIAAFSADAVITHSNEEAQALAKQIPAGKVHTVRWSVPLREVTRPFAERSGVAFIGGYSHEPNVDAARWLIDEIMPQVRKRQPNIECFLVGSNLPEQIRRSCGNGVTAVGHVKDLNEIFDKVRLTVAPLNFGAGIKGKVVESLAAGVPCVCTPVGAEGLEFPPALQDCVADGAKALAALICDLHEAEGKNQACGSAGVAYVAELFSEARLDAGMRGVLGPFAPAQAAAAAELNAAAPAREPGQDSQSVGAAKTSPPSSMSGVCV